MKKLLFFAMALFYVGIASAKINTVVVRTSGDVFIRQGSEFSVRCLDESEAKWVTEDSVLYLRGRGDYEVTIEALGYLDVASSGDVRSEGVLMADNLTVWSSGSGDVILNLDYNNLYVQLTGSGDVILQGHCDQFQVDDKGSGDVVNAMSGAKRMIPNMAGLSELLEELGANLEMLSDSVNWRSFERDMERWGESMEEWGRHMEEWGNQVERRMEGRDKPRGHHGDLDKPHYGPKPQPQPQPQPEPKKNLLFNAHWNGFDAGLNMLFNPHLEATLDGDPVSVDPKIRALRSWYFGFNLADVGVAFNYRHTAGLFTGVGIGWNNFSWAVTDPEVKKDKLGLLYLQVPLMVELRPTRGLFVDLGVTTGLRFNAWTKVKYKDGTKDTEILDNRVTNPFRVDATLRVGDGDLGFFAQYALIPIYPTGVVEHTRPLSFGFSLLF